MADNSWKNLAEDAINDLFMLYVQDQMLAVIRHQMNVTTFVSTLTAARDRRADVLEAIDAL